MSRYNDIEIQKDAINEQLTASGAKYRIAFMTQDKHTRITILVGTPAQIEKSCGERSLLHYASVKDAGLFLSGMAAVLAANKNF